mgnify:CR=1 FL=1
MRVFFYFIALQFAVLASVQANEFKQIELTDFRTNKAVNLSKFDGNKPTYIKLWATWCKPCMEQMPHFQSLQEKYGDQINILAVNININESMKYIDDVITNNGLTMPVLLDKEGKLSEALGLVGTPFSVLINIDNKIVYTTHESDAVLDTFVDKLANGSKLASEGSKAVTAIEKKNIIKPWLEGSHTLFFTATWCDWYLKDSRPEMANSCEEIQSNIAKIFDKNVDKEWHGFVNHLWTDKKALSEFTQLYNITFPTDIDTNGVLFTHFNIRSIPTIIKIEDGKVIKKITGDEIKEHFKYK